VAIGVRAQADNDITCAFVTQIRRASGVCEGVGIAGGGLG